MNLAPKLGKLMTLSVTANLLTEHAVFVYYSGHCNVIALHVTVSKQDYTNRIFDEDLHIDVFPEKLDETLERWMEYLNGLLEVAVDD